MEESVIYHMHINTDSMSYMLKRRTKQTDNDPFCFRMDTFINIYDQYEKMLFSLVFSFILLLLLLFPRETIIKHILFLISSCHFFILGLFFMI